MSKTVLYEDLLKRMDLAIEQQFFLEASWIQYAIVEDRLNSVIRHAFPTNGKAYLAGRRLLSKRA